MTVSSGKPCIDKRATPDRVGDFFIEPMTPDELAQGGVKLRINYGFYESPFGQVIIASSPKGICHLFFEDDNQQALATLKQRFPQASYQLAHDKSHEIALRSFQLDKHPSDRAPLHLNGTLFQLQVWQKLLEIPSGTLTTYGDIAHHIMNPGAVRAVGTAIGKNPIGFLIPCHRVIQQSGRLGGYRWGEARKSFMIEWEAAHKGSLYRPSGIQS